MDDLISRAAAIAKVEKARKNARTLTGMDFVLLLKGQPAVDAKPVVHGRWLDDYCAGNGHDDIYCSVCLKDATSFVNSCDEIHWSKDKPQYCPNCGAKMDGERRDNNGADA